MKTQGLRRRHVQAVAFACTCGVFLGSAGATQYNVVPLATTGPGVGGQANGIYNGQVVGDISGTAGVLWTDPTHFIPLGPPPTGSIIYGISGAQQVGVVGSSTDRNEHAAVWSGTAASVVRLDSATSTTVALATDGTQQVGYTENGAVLWTGTAASEMSLNPSAYGFSKATAVSNGVQVGFGGNVPGTDALLWHGSPTNHVVLRTGAEALGIANGQVVGFAGINGTNVAALWTNGTPGSFMNLAPAGTTASELFATNGSVQVGDVSLTTAPGGLLPPDHHAGVWSGSSTSFQMLPTTPNHNYSIATGIDAQGDISGYIGVQNAGAVGEFQPVIWQAVPEPTALALFACAGAALLRRRRR